MIHSPPGTKRRNSNSRKARRVRKEKAHQQKRLNPWRYQRPDLDKMVRAVCDALEVAGVVGEDSRIASIEASKIYAPMTHNTGAQIGLSQCAVDVEWRVKEEK